jgi:hypothetical protein
MKQVKVTRIHAVGDRELEAQLQGLQASRIVSVEFLSDGWHKVVYEIDDVLQKDL